MCRHKGYTPEQEEHRERWYAQENEQTDKDNGNYYATAYMQPALTAGIPIILRNDDGQNISIDAFWGILPPWKHTFKEAVTTAKNLVNVRSETVYEGTLYPPLLKKKQRCLLPCSYYFEHHHFNKIGKKGQVLQAKDNVPFLIQVNHRPLFAVPGLYSHWYDKESRKTLTTYSMFTIVANDLLAAIHDDGDNRYRMPLVIERDMEDVWLNPASSDRQINEILNYQMHSDQLRAHAVAPLTGKAAKQGEAIIEEADWTEYTAEIDEIKNTGKTPNTKAVPQL
jgi:putative SOS response-associated peptidase YedK